MIAIDQPQMIALLDTGDTWQSNYYDGWFLKSTEAQNRNAVYKPEIKWRKGNGPEICEDMFNHRGLFVWEHLRPEEIIDLYDIPIGSWEYHRTLEILDHNIYEIQASGYYNFGVLFYPRV